MRNTIIVIALVMVVGAFIIGSFKGSADDREDKRTDEGSQDLLGFKTYTTGAGIKSAMDKLQLTIPEADRAAFYGQATSSTLSPATCQQMANDLFDSKGYALDDDENKVLGVIKQLTCLMDMWKVQIFFEKIFSDPIKLLSPTVIYINLKDPSQKNWIGYIQNFLDDAEQTDCAAILKKLPLCIVKGKKYKVV